MDSELIKSLDDWLLYNEKKYAEEIKRQKLKIPAMLSQYNKILYRGMIVDENFLIAVHDKKMTFKDITSWTKEEKIAEKFVSDKKFITSKKSGIKLILKKKITAAKIIFDIHTFVLMTGGMGLDELNIDSAYKEQEVLVDKGIKIVEKDVIILK